MVISMNLEPEAAPDRRVQITQPEHYTSINGTVRRTTPKLRGKAAVKAAKRARQQRLIALSVAA